MIGDGLGYPFPNHPNDGARKKELTGQEMDNALEDMVDFCLLKKRIRSRYLCLCGWSPLLTRSHESQGATGFWFENPGFVDADVFMEYIKGKTLQEPSEELVTLSLGD